MALIRLGLRSRGFVAAAWSAACVACNGLTGANDLSIGAAADMIPDASVVAPPTENGGPVPQARDTYHREVTLVPLGASARLPALIVLRFPFPYEHLKPNGEDLRFSTTRARSDDVPYYIESWNAGGQSRIWVRPSAVPPSGTIHMFYGDADAGAATNFATVFPRSLRTAGGGIGSFTATANIDVDWFELTAGDTLTLPPGSALTIAAARVILSGSVEGTGRGYAGGAIGSPGAGPGGGVMGASGSAAGGGGYGGVGGKGGSDTAAGGAGGATYGTTSGDDIAMGSGGAGSDKRAGGAGGGGLTVLGWSVSATGALRANGANGDGAAGQNAGGGAGGGVLLAGARLELGGATITANGGAGGPCVDAANDGGGGGGGGRIKLRHGDVYIGPTSMTSAGGAGSKVICTAAAGADGAAGTLNVEARLPADVRGYYASLGPEN